LATNSSGATGPSTTYAYQWWYDTTANILKIRNAVNSAWINFASFDQGAGTWSISGDLTIADKIVHSGDTNTAIRFPANDTVTVETNGAERLRITSAGNVGIGNSSPAHKLHVYSDTALDHVRIDGPVVNRNIAFTTNNSFRWNLYATGATETGSNAGSDFNIARYNDAGTFLASAFTITRSSGNVGIGITSPSQALDVNGTANATNFTRGGSQVYSRNNIVGTVSEVSGVPTGAVIESGSNANGEYVKFADGTMICTFTVATSASAAVTKTLPATFVDSLYSAVGTNVNSTNSADITVKFSNRTTTTVGVVLTSNGALLASTANCIAIGRWY
jgi:hypothetical protein